MTRKPEIQYIGQFYVYGSEARQLEEKPQVKKPKTRLPLARLEKIQKVYVDPVALCGIAVAVFMLVTLTIGAVQLHNAWQEHQVMRNYLYELKHTNNTLEHDYHAGYNLADIEVAALAMGMIPANEAQTMTITVQIPEPTPEPTWWEDVVWFMKGLFA